MKRRKLRQRFKLSKAKQKRCRLIVSRSNNHIYAQILAATNADVLVSFSSLSKEGRAALKNGASKVAAEYVGKMVALKAIEKDIKDIVFDRSGYSYHGRIKILAESARANGLNF